MKRIRCACFALLAAFLLMSVQAEALPPQEMYLPDTETDASEAVISEPTEPEVAEQAALELENTETAMPNDADPAVLNLPADTLTVGVSAFEGDPLIERVVLPDGLERIEARAFANSGVMRIVMPASVSEIADDAFESCSERLVVEGAPGSPAQRYCAEHGITFQYHSDEGPEPDWSGFDALIDDIRSNTDFNAREASMHRAEDMLMDTGAVIPLYYYNDAYLQKDTVSGIYANLYGFKFFQNATVKGSDTLRICLAPDPHVLDPALNSSVDGACLASLAFGGLYTSGANGAPEPNFATGYEVSADGRTYTFAMRSGLKWSDGSDLTAKDFEYSWKRAASTGLEADYGFMFSVIRGYPDNLAVTASQDGGTLTVQLDAPCAYMLELMAFPAFYAVNRACVEASADDGPGAWATSAGFVCSGPFTLGSWSGDDEMVFVRNPNYWDAGGVSLQSIRCMLSDDDDAVYAAYRSGKLDFIDSFPIGSAAMQDSGFHIVDNLGIYYMCFNVKSPLFEGMSVEQAALTRRAISLLIDRRYIVDDINAIGQKPANTFVPAGMSDGHGGVFRRNDGSYTYPDSANTGYFGFSPDVPGAISLLKQAGFVFESGMLTEETPLAFEYTINNGSGHLAIAEAVQADLAAIGIDMTVQSCSWGDFQGITGSGDFVAARGGWIADFNDPINMLEMWITDSGNNICQFGC